MKFDNDELLDYLIATDTLDEFLGNDENEEIKREIKEIENYIKGLEKKWNLYRVAKEGFRV